MKTGILFDLDGTLWDASEGVVTAWNIALERMGRSERVTMEWMQRLMGKTMDDIGRNIFPDEGEESMQRMMKECTDEENALLAERGGVLFDGVEETLAELKRRGYFLAVVSNCQEGYIEAFEQAHGFTEVFDDMENFGRTGRGKAWNIDLVVRRNRLDRVVYLGDTRGDYDAAAEAGVPFLHAAYGYGEVPAGTPSITSFRELPKALEEMIGAL